MLENIEIDDKSIEDLIHEIRGKQVMLDSDLARLYKCKNGTKEINQAVKNSIEKFPGRFSWKLNDLEVEALRSKILTTSYSTMSRSAPRVFTEQGVAMLATILHTPVATQISIRIMDAFINMRHYISNNELRLSNAETKIIEHDESIRLLQKSFEKFEEKKKINDIYFNGQIFDAYNKIYELFSMANKSLIIVDNYADLKILDIIKKLSISVVLITKENNLLSKIDIDMYNRQYSNLKIIYDNTFHDRFFILDNNILYHCGTSVNRIGYKTFAINLFTDLESSKLLIDRINKIVEKCVDFEG